MVVPQDPIGKLQTMIHEDGLQAWLPTLFAILILSILPIAVVAFITLIHREGELHEPEKGQLRTSDIWEGIREPELSEPEQKISQMSRQIRMAFDPPSECAGPGQKASEMGKPIEEFIDSMVNNTGTVRRRKLSMVEV